MSKGQKYLIRNLYMGGVQEIAKGNHVVTTLFIGI